MINSKRLFLFIAFVSVLWISCSRNDIEFGNIPDNNYTNIVYIDSVDPRVSTVVLDSFPTSNITSFLVGKYKDPYFGVISSKPFFQMTIPSEIPDIASTSKFDSACFIIHLSKYYYGDTSRSQTVTVNELAQAIDFSYNNNLYNTSNIPAKPVILGSKTLKIQPSRDDSIIIPVNTAKGSELYNKLQQKSEDVTKDDNFQIYFKGVSLSVHENDTTAIYGLTGAAGNIILRIYYHTTIPSPENKWIDFISKANNYSFNQVIANRAGTILYSPTTGIKEFSSTAINDLAFTQYGAGVLLKIIFPSLKGIVATDKILKLQKAELIIRPMGQTYGKFKLPSKLYLAQTNATNAIGAEVLDPTLSNIQYASPDVDELYGLNTHYRFNITSYITAMLAENGTEDDGFFLLENKDQLHVNRAVIGDYKQPQFKTQLVLTALTINK